MSVPTLPRLDAAHVLSALSSLRQSQPVKYAAFYSSQLGGVVTDPALMVLPFDDHMVHRGHGIFDTAGLVDGRIYDLEAHLDRFERSAAHSRLTLPLSREAMRDIIVGTVAASGTRTAPFATGCHRGPAASSSALPPVQHLDFSSWSSPASPTPSGGTPMGCG